MTRKRVLVVEDDADARLGYHVLLTANHYDTAFAADSSAAVAEARKHQPDVILLDLGLPAGDGFIVLEQFRASAPLSMIPVVVVSARGRQGDMERALEGGAKAYLQKPWNDSELLALIDQLISPADLSLSQPV